MAGIEGRLRAGIAAAAGTEHGTVIATGVAGGGREQSYFHGLASDTGAPP